MSYRDMYCSICGKELSYNIDREYGNGIIAPCKCQRDKVEQLEAEVAKLKNAKGVSHD